MKEWLNNLKPGDEVFVSQRYGKPSERVIVERLTKAHIVTKGGKRFRKRDGVIVGADTWSMQILQEPTSRRREEWRVHRLKQAAWMWINRLTVPNDSEKLIEFVQTLKELVENDNK
jgi:ribosomal protein L14